MKNKFLLILVVAAALLCGCEASQKGGGGGNFEGAVGGLIEKGPFVQGSTVTLSELNDKLEPTGKSTLIRRWVTMRFRCFSGAEADAFWV